MHPSVKEWAKSKVEQYDLAAKDTLEMGSLDVNGTVREFFTGPYFGVDLQDGPGVDRVCSAASVPFADETFDVVVTTEMLEHDPTFWLTFPEAARVLKPGGFMLVTTRGIGFPFHEFPHDYWRFTEDSIRYLFEYARLTPLEIVPDTFPGHPGVFGIARKDYK